MNRGKSMIPHPILAQSRPFVYGLCLVLAAGFLFLCFQWSRMSKRGKHKGIRVSPQNSSAGGRHAADLAEFRSVFADKVEAFRKDMLAYQLERLVWKNEFPIATIEKIRTDYGKVLLQPSLYIYEDLNRLHLLEDDLVTVEREWFQKRGSSVPAGELKEEIEKIIFEEEHAKAVHIAKQAMPNGKEFVDYMG